MSHELHTPLNAIIGYSEMLQEEAGARSRADFVPDLKKIQAAGKQLLALIDEVLDLSKIETGRMELRPSTFAVRELLEELETTVQPQVEKNGNLLVVDCPPEVGSIEADRSRLTQVLFNLLSNACKLTERGTITLAARRELLDGEDRVSFHVSDAGRGFGSEDLERLFQSFGGVELTAPGPQAGSVLGLAITRRFAQMMGGDIDVESQPGKGATFTVWLPARPFAAPAPAVAETVAAASAPIPPAAKPRAGVRS
jgi:signal transduction histidine kinase